MEEKLKKDYSYYFIQLHLMLAQLQKWKAAGQHEAKHLELYLAQILNGIQVLNLTPEESRRIEALKKDAREFFGA